MRQAPVVLISGCSTGIGRQLARTFWARGAQVIATARKPGSLAALTEHDIRTEALDVTDADSIRRLVQALDREGIVVDILVNNAGYGLMGPISEIPPDQIRRQFDTNLTGLLALTQALLPPMRARGSGCIVNIGSVSGILVTPFAGAYCASKAAVHAVSDALRMELAPFGIQVVTVQPGAIRSSFGATASAGLAYSRLERSDYAPIAAAVADRANASQQHATSTEAFANALVDALLDDRPPAVLRIGSGSRMLPLLAALLPRSWRDRLLARRFGLRRLTALRNRANPQSAPYSR